MIFLVTKEEFENTYQSDWETQYSASFVSESNLMYPIMWDYDKNRCIFSQSMNYQCTPIQTFDTEEELNEWLWGSGSNEYYNWLDEVHRADEDEVMNDPYGIDGPFPEEMDSIGEAHILTGSI